MVFFHWLLSATLSSSLLFATAESDFQTDIDADLIEIMQTHTGKAICQYILGGQSDAIEFHLGVSPQAAATIAKNCKDERPSAWVFTTSYQTIRKLTLNVPHPRKYGTLSPNTDFPIESWTDPFTNTTVLVNNKNGLPRERRIQLIAHELAVYFDSKANPAHPDAQNIPQLKALNFANVQGFSPLVAVSNPLTAHTLTFIRALQVEFSIVDELIKKGVIVPPVDNQDPYLRFLISDRCQEKCLEELVLNMRQAYIPLDLAFIAFASHYRSILFSELTRLRPPLTPAQWSSFQALQDASVSYVNAQPIDNPLANLQGMYSAVAAKTTEGADDFLSHDLWRLEWPAIQQARVNDGRTLLQFMKTPLLSGYNVLLSSGPRVRVRSGNVE